MKHAVSVVILHVVLVPMMAFSAGRLDECAAEKYKPCSVFRASRTIVGHTPIIDSHIAGYTRSKGSWQVRIYYRPPEQCAKVSLTVDMGGVDAHRTYDYVFDRGSGVFNDSGFFLHEKDDVESGLRILTRSCRVPDSKSEGFDADAQERMELEEEWERLDLEEEWKRLALEEERQRIEERAARLAREQERRQERQRLARGRERLRLKRERERERLKEEEEEEEDKTVKRAANMNILAGILSGIATGLSQDSGGGQSGRALLDALGRLDRTAGMDSSGSCGRAQRRAERILRTARNRSVTGMCSTARHYVNTLESVRRALATGDCPAHALRMYDATISQARKTARASCN